MVGLLLSPLWKLLSEGPPAGGAAASVERSVRLEVHTRWLNCLEIDFQDDLGSRRRNEVALGWEKKSL